MSLPFVLRRHICLFNGGSCCYANCTVYRGLAEYSRSFISCSGRTVESGGRRSPVTVRRVPPDWLKSIIKKEAEA